MSELRFCIVGAGFWARYQLAAWQEVPGARCIAVCDRTQTRARELADQHGITAVYADPQEMIVRERPDFVDVITHADTHAEVVQVAARHGVAAICQKPLAPALGEARAMQAACADAGVPLLVHENWRWQTPIRALKGALDGGIGRPFRARLDFISSFPVFDNQPALKALDPFILADMGSHIFDVARFLFGEAAQVFCQTHRVRPDIRGEDVATALMVMGSARTSVGCQLSYASRTEHERFPETFIFIEGEHGSIELAPDYWLRVTTADGTLARRVPPPFYPWADPRYALVHASIPACHANLLASLRGGGAAETTAEDNLRTLEIVSAACQSARHNQVVPLPLPPSTTT